MTQTDFESFKNANQDSTQFGAVTTVLHWPIVQFIYSLDGQPPLAQGRKEEVVVTTTEGDLPKLTGQTTLGEVTLSSATLGALPAWPDFEAQMKAALEIAWAEQQERLAAEQAPPPEPEPA